MMTLISLLAFGLLSVQANPSPIHCKLVRVQQTWTGACAGLFDETPVLTASAASSVKSGRYQTGKPPTAVYAGEMKMRAETVPIELEFYSGGTGILRPEGLTWLVVTDMRSRPDALEFDVDPAQRVAPSDLDREIVVRAAAILSSTSVWDRADDRLCGPQDKTWSIYCSMIRATLEVTGGIHHRRPAMELVREIVEERSAGRQYEHRLRDYNNDPATTFADVQSLFKEALNRLKR